MECSGTWRLGLQIPGEAFRIRESELKDGDKKFSGPPLISELSTLPCLSLSIHLNLDFIIFPWGGGEGRLEGVVGKEGRLGGVCESSQLRV